MNQGATPPELNLALSFSDEDDVVSCTLDVVSNDRTLALATADEDDTAACTLTAEVSAELALSDDDDDVSVIMDNEAANTVIGMSGHEIVAAYQLRHEVERKRKKEQEREKREQEEREREIQELIAQEQARIIAAQSDLERQETLERKKKIAEHYEKGQAEAREFEAETERLRAWAEQEYQKTVAARKKAAEEQEIADIILMLLMEV